MDMSELMHQQFLLARYGIPLSESNIIADFEREAFVDIAVKYEKIRLQLESMSPIPT
jgi:hypothetical protein